MIKPIHGADLAEVCVNSITSDEKEINVGGPTELTFRQIAELAFKVQNKEVKISSLPLWLIHIIIPLLRIFTSSKTYGPLEFLMTAMTMDGVGDSYGKESLEDFFASQIT